MFLAYSELSAIQTVGLPKRFLICFSSALYLGQLPTRLTQLNRCLQPEENRSLMKKFLLLLIPILAMAPGPPFAYAQGLVSDDRTAAPGTTYVGLGLGVLWYDERVSPENGVAMRAHPNYGLLLGHQFTEHWSMDGQFQRSSYFDYVSVRAGYHLGWLPGLSFGPTVGMGVNSVSGHPDRHYSALVGASIAYDLKISKRSSLGLDVSAIQAIGVGGNEGSFSPISTTLQWKYFLE